MGHSLCSFILRQIPRRSPTHNAVYFTTTRLGGYIILLNIQHRAILYQHITIMNIQDSSFIITQFGTGKCVIRDSAIKHFIKLTLFPSYSVTVELTQV